MVRKLDVEELDLTLLIIRIWSKRRYIIVFTIIVSLIGAGYALILPNKYESVSKFVPHFSGDKAPSSLGGIAALAGINLNSLGGGDEIPPNLYPEVANSIPFRLEILNTEVNWKESKVRYADYLSVKRNKGIRKVTNFLSEIPSMLLNRSKKNEIDLNENDDLLRITDDDYDLIEDMDKIISVTLNEKEGFVFLAVKEEDAEVAGQIAKAAEGVLQKYIIDFKIKQSEYLLEYTSSQLAVIQNQLYGLQDSLATFKEQNQNISSVFKENELLRLESRYAMVESVYGELAMQKAQAELQVKKDTPIFSVISPVTVANKKSGPGRLIIVIFWTFLGFAISIASLFIRDAIGEVKKKLKSE